MAILNVNPTRMELNRLKKQLIVARRGHKLLKDKRDELMRQFLEIIRENRQLRETMERLLNEAHRQFLIASAVMNPAYLREALMAGKEQMKLSVGTVNVMSVDVPVFEMNIGQNSLAGSYPYGMASTTGELDMAVSALNEAFPVMLRLAEIEKKAQLLADEIEKTRRRVNSLEYVMIPNYEQTIRSITMKLDESERGNLTRLMKVKDMIVKQAIEAAKKADAEAAAV
ncbi:MAG: V-type ATP synthase subunit D [Saccharofermentanales bacterium]